ncbi:MAG: acyltransferase domain-containing protein [Desulfovibrio sp.]|nr:acyltransferase domain-containing protein [Desulfovibrio sp.]
MSEAFSCPQQSVLTYDGVRYGRLVHQGQTWLFGASTQNWAELLPLSGQEPASEELARLARKGLWLAKEGECEPLAVMCQGMGALWPGAGRELYDEFPRAREAMDRIAAIASWDVLGLLDCREHEKITATRWQIPYLFLLEYAQWAYLSSLGLSPALICGHSLGELIALCFAGIYSPEVAWHILDTRAEHVAKLEAQATEEFSMLAVHANQELVEDLLAQNPKVRVANYNTPSQFILGGPKLLIRDLRSSLRKKRIPAVSIAVSMLFHHPAMRILREHSLLRLNMLEMHAPAIPVLSVCKCQPYPSEQAEICQFIADLDENPVRFSDMLARLWTDYGVRSFVELGPQEVLCGLISENLPKAQVMSPARKGHEARGLRELCARLYAEGRLKQKALEKAISVYGTNSPVTAEKPVETQPIAPEKSATIHPLFLLLAELTGLDASEITCELDLRKDLALRSSSFPHFLLEAEKRFHSLPSFAELVEVVTVGDLLRLFTKDEASAATVPSFPKLTSRLQPLASFAVTADGFRQACYAHPYLAKETLPVLGLVASEELAGPLLRLLLPDLLLGLPGLVREIRLEQSLAEYCRDTLDCPLPLTVCSKDAVVASDWLLMLGDVQVGTSCSHAPCSQQRLRLKLLSKSADFSNLPNAAQDTSERLIIIDCCDRRRRFYELGDWLSRELALGRSRSTLWTGQTKHPALMSQQNAVPLSFWRPDRQQTPLLVPMRTPADSLQISQLAARVFFDPSADPRLYGQKSVPLAHRLLPLLEAAGAQAPWLEVFGFTDLCVKGDLDLPTGLVREGYVNVNCLNWLNLSGEQRRCVAARLTLVDLSPNGRKTRKLSDNLQTTVLLGRETVKENPLPDWVGAWQAFCPTKMSSTCFVTTMASAHLLNITYGPEGLMAEMDTGYIAQPEEMPYIQKLYLFQDVVEAAQLFLRLVPEKLDQQGSRFFAKAGFVFLSPSLSEVRPRLCLRRTFSDEFRERFDAVVFAQSRPLLLVSQLEFVKAFG